MPKTLTDPFLALGGLTMGTRWSVLIDDLWADPAFQDRFQAAVDEVDAQMSTWSANSDLMHLNAAPLDVPVPLPDRLIFVLEAALAISSQTSGAFEPNLGDVVSAWGFGPDTIDLKAIKAASTASRVPARSALILDRAGGYARKSAALSLDLSGIAKGYGVDRLAEVAQELGLCHVLCSIDGEVRAVGTRRHGQPWSVGVETPDDTVTARHSVLELADMAVATSGDYRHFVTVAQTRLSHTMDPKRGAPLVASPASVTVLAKSCMMADAMATALMVMGERHGLEYANDHKINALFLHRTSAGTTAIGTGIFATPTNQWRTALGDHIDT